MAPPAAPLPDDLLIDAADEIAIRQDLTLTALGKRPADRVFTVGRLLDVHSRQWRADQEIVVKGRRIAFVGPGRLLAGRGGGADRRAVAFRGARLRRGAQAYRELASDAGIRDGAGDAAWRHLGLRSEPRILQRQRGEESRILADRPAHGLADEDLPAARLGRAADRL